MLPVVDLTGFYQDVAVPVKAYEKPKDGWKSHATLIRICLFDVLKHTARK